MLDALKEWCEKNIKHKEACNALIKDVERLYTGVSTISGKSWFKLSKDFRPVAIGLTNQEGIEGLQIVFMSSKRVIFHFVIFKNGMSGYAVYYPDSEYVQTLKQLFEN